MRAQNYLHRMTVALAVGSLLLGPGAAPFARAQTAPDADAVDPPARVGRLAGVVGTVSFHIAGQTEWAPATANYPVTSGNSFWTQPGSAADVELGSTRLSMDQGTELDVDTLDDHNFTTTLPQGALFLNVRAVEAGDSYEIITPRGVVTIGQPGRYEVVAGDMANPTTVTVVEGAAQITGEHIDVPISDGQSAQLTGAENFQASVGAEVSNPLLTRVLTSPPVPRPTYAPPPVVTEMTGGDALAETGSWATTPEYGQVWYPPVPAEWVPYREGHWSYVAPWGWTWVDNAPWGFAPFHYGRWVQIGPRWGWIPVVPGIADYGRPVYSPALVSFVGLGVGAAIGASVGWIPLGPHEPYRPPYHASDAYLRRMNMADGARITDARIDHFANRNGATIVPTAAMRSSQPIGQRVERVTPEALARARPDAAIPARPTATGGAFSGRPAAPGPDIHARPTAAPSQAGAHFAPDAPHVVEPGRPAMGPGPVIRRPTTGGGFPNGARPAFAPHAAPSPQIRREAPQFRPAAPGFRPAPQRGEEPRRF